MGSTGSRRTGGEALVVQHEGTKTRRGLRIGVDEEEIAAGVIDSAIAVHRALGPGLLETVYEQCLAHELTGRGLAVRRQLAVPVVYRDIRIEAGFRMDMLVGERLVVEVKAVESLLPVHSAQVLTYLKLSGLRLGLLLNFNVPLLKQGIRRLVL
jgi:GxxExxY protein